MHSPYRHRDTPTRSQQRSPIKATNRPDIGLHLERVIGSTCQSSLRFAANASNDTFAYVAGAAVVLASVDADLKVTQRFFCANAAQTSVSRVHSTDGPSTPSAVAQELRNRLGGRTREGSPFTGSHQAGTDSSGSSSSHAKDRVKAATAVALSRDGKWLAVGETGYKPRVLVFPITDKKSTDVPAAIISEHSFGVQAVAFDSQSKLLATLGTLNDGYLCVWHLDPRDGSTSLMARNKCTTLVKHIAWMGRSLVTVGVRYIKVWRPDELTPSTGSDRDASHALSNPGHKPLAGRNTLLGDILEATFTTVVSLSETKAVVCSENGDICLLDDTDKQQRLSRFARETFCVTAACLSPLGELILAGRNGDTKILSLATVERIDTPTSRPSTPIAKKVDAQIAVHPVALGSLSQILVNVDSQRGINFSRHPSGPISTHSSYLWSPAFVSHSEAILGVRSLKSHDDVDGEFATWSADGKVIGWTAEGVAAFQVDVPLEQVDDAQEYENRLKTVAFVPGSVLVITGDRYGVLGVMDVNTGQCQSQIRAHSSEITSIVVRKDGEMTCIATGSRDRHVQVFKLENGTLELLQTLDEHAGAVTSVCFLEKDGVHLISCSADRTVVVRESHQMDDNSSSIFTIVRTINLKSAPTAMASGDCASLYIASADRCLNLVDIEQGKIISSRKLGDAEGGDSTNLSSLGELRWSDGTTVIAGVSASDKSVRIYSQDAQLLARDWGHTEGVTDIAVLPSRSDTANASEMIVTVALDGTTFIWSVPRRKPMNPSTRADGEVFVSSASASPLSQQPVRKILPNIDMNRLRRSMVSPPTDDDSDAPVQARSPATGLRKRPSRLQIGQAPILTPTTPRFSSTTPTDESGGTPTGRFRSPSPSKSSHMAARSVSRSPERLPSRRASNAELRVHGLGSSHSPAATQRPLVMRAHTSDSTSPTRRAHQDKIDVAQVRTGTEHPTAAELTAHVKKFKESLSDSGGRGTEEDGKVLMSLKGEVESLLRELSLMEQRLDAKEDDGSGLTDRNETSSDGPAAAAGKVVLESVEERE